MRVIPAGLQAELDSEAMRLCYLVKVTRQDSAVLGFTTHDQDVVLGGVTYEALSAVKMSNIRQEAGGNAGNVDTIGVLDSARISEADMRAGLYDNADVSVMLCDWSNTALGSVTLFRGFIGDVTITDGMYTAGMRSLMQRFQQQVGELASPNCRVFRLGDARCKFNLAGNTVDGNPARSTVAVTSVDDPTVLHLSGNVTVVGYYNYGELLSTSGANSGHMREVKLHSQVDGLVSSTVSPSSGLPTGNLSYKRPVDYTPSATLTFAIPAGNWEMGSLLITSTWAIRNVLNTGTDLLTFQLPPGQVYDVIMRSNSADGTYTDAQQVGEQTLTAINAAAGSTFQIGLRHTATSPYNAPFYNLGVSVVQLVLSGPGGGTSSRVVLHEAFPFAVSPGDAFQITTGCNRLPGTCTQKFANIVNFRGEPHLPGTEKLLERGRPPQ